MICKQCGAKIDDNAAVCEFCGEVYADVVEVKEEVSVPLEAEDTEAIAENAAEEVAEITELVDDEKIDEMMEENDAMRQAQMDRIRTEKQVRLEEIERRRIEKKRRQKRNRILVALLAVLCVGAVGLGAYYLTSNGDYNDDVVIVTPRPTEQNSTIPVVTEKPTEVPAETLKPTEAPAVVTPVTQKPVVTKKPTTAKPAATKKPTAAKPAVTAKPTVNNAADFNTVASKFGGAQIFASSSTALLTDANLSGLTKSELRVARNEIYARHGRGFNNNSLQAYFNNCSWYKLDSNYDYANEYLNLNSVEKANIKLIKTYEAK